MRRKMKLTHYPASSLSLLLACNLPVARAGNRTRRKSSNPGQSNRKSSLEEQQSPTASAAHPARQHHSSELILPEDLVYRGAFRLPDGSGGSNWDYSGTALTWYPQGDPNGSADGFPGSLFGSGHDHHLMVSEIGIPQPVMISDNVDDLNTAETLAALCV